MWHNLVNTRYFSEAAIDFRNNGGRYTLAPRGSKEYFEYWAIQEERCKNGYKVGNTWIPGRMYFYLNFFPMWKVDDKIALQALEERRGVSGKITKRTAEKILDFPKFTEMQYEWWRFKHIAWNGGTFMGINSLGGKHICCAKTRGAGFSYMEAADGIYNYNFIDGSKSYYFAAIEQYLTKDGILNKVQEGLDWINQHIPYWKQNRQKKNTLLHQKASYIDSQGTERGSLSEIIGVSVDNANKAHPYSARIYTTSGYKNWEEIKVNDYVFGSNGMPTKVVGTFEQGEQDIYTIRFSDGREVKSTIDHLWTISHWAVKKTKYKFRRELVSRTETLGWIKDRVEGKSYKTNKIKVQLNGCVNYPRKRIPIDPYTLGLMLGDGSIGKTTKNISQLTMKWDDVDAIQQFVPYKITKAQWGGDIRNSIHIPDGKELFRGLNLLDTKASTKFVPDIYKFNSKEIRLQVLNGLLDTEGSVTGDFGVIEFASKSLQLSKDFIWLARSLGYGASMKSKLIKGIKYYRCYIYSSADDTQLFNLPRKKKRVSLRKSNGKATWITKWVHIESIKFSHREQAKCIEVEANDHLYLIEDFVVTHNTRGKRGRKITFEEAGSFPNLKAALEISLGSLRDGDLYVGQMSVFGTGGEEGPGIEGLEDVFYNPEAWDMLEFPNVWENAVSSSCGYFVPSFRANFLYHDENGNCDMKSAIASDNVEREKKKKSKDQKALDRRKAEYPQKPSEAFQRLHNNGFNIAEIDAQIRKIESSQALQTLIRYGQLVYSESKDALNGVEFLIQSKEAANPIIEFPHKNTENTDLSGCVTIYERPYVDLSGKVPTGMYQVVFDAYYKEEAQDRTSLFAVYVFKQNNLIDPSFNELPVASYVGRPSKLKICYEHLFKLADYYNCTVQGEIAGGGQGVVDYAKEKRILHKVEFEPEMLHNKEIAAKTKNRSYLMNMTTDRKRLGMIYLEDWHTTQRGIDENGNPILNIHKIYDVGLLREMRKAGPDVNTDRLSACLIGMFMLKENITKRLKSRVKQSSFFSRTLFGGNSENAGVTTMY